MWFENKITNLHEEFKPNNKDVIIEQIGKVWTAKHYNGHQPPALIYRDTNRTMVRAKASAFARTNGTKVFSRMKSGNLILEIKDNQHLIPKVEEKVETAESVN